MRIGVALASFDLGPLFLPPGPRSFGMGKIDLAALGRSERERGMRPARCPRSGGTEELACPARIPLTFPAGSRLALTRAGQPRSHPAIAIEAWPKCPANARWRSAEVLFRVTSRPRSSPSRSKRNSMNRKLLKRNEMLYLVLRSQPRHRPPDFVGFLER